MNQFNQVLNTILDNGIMFALSAIFVYAAIKLIDIFVQYLKHKLEDRLILADRSKRMEARNAASDQIQRMIEDSLNIYKYHRIQIVEFSNSVKSIANLPFKYMSCTYEVVPIGTKAAGHKLDRVSTSLFTPFFSKLASSEYVILDKQNKIDSHFMSTLSDLLEETPTEGCIFDMMLTLKGKAIGYIMITKESAINNEDVQNVQLLSNKISALLSVLDK